MSARTDKAISSSRPWPRATGAQGQALIEVAGEARQLVAQLTVHRVHVPEFRLAFKRLQRAPETVGPPSRNQPPDPAAGPLRLQKGWRRELGRTSPRPRECSPPQRSGHERPSLSEIPSFPWSGQRHIRRSTRRALCESDRAHPSRAHRRRTPAAFRASSSAVRLRAAPSKQALVEQRLQYVRIGVTDGFGSLVGTAAREDRQSREETPARRRE